MTMIINKMMTMRMKKRMTIVGMMCALLMMVSLLISPKRDHHHKEKMEAQIATKAHPKRNVGAEVVFE